MTPAGPFRYHLFGLNLESEIALPELAGQASPGDLEPADLRIAIGSAKASDGNFLLDIAEVAQFAISSGRLIIVEPCKGAADREIRLFLLGSAMGIALHQRGILPLHANAIEVDGRAVAFMGYSGSGKSTLAAWFHDQGFRILADDVCVVRMEEDGRPMAYPGLPRLRLWQDALEASGRSAKEHAPSFHIEGDQRQKFDIPLRSEGVAAEALPLAALFILEAGAVFAIDKVSGAEAVEMISANTYRGAYIGQVGDLAKHVASCSALAQAVPVYRLSRPFDRSNFQRQCETILKLCRAHSPGD